MEVSSLAIDYAPVGGAGESISDTGKHDWM